MRIISNSYKQFFALALLLVSTSMLFAQSYNSPYSRFGLGDLANNNFMYTRAMGGIGSGYADASTMNPVNPASYSFLNLATYEVGINSEYAKISDGKVTEERWKGNLEYIGLAFPLRNYKNELFDPKKRKFKFGMAFYAKPYSRVNYEVATSEDIEDIGPVTRVFTGTGGTYNIGWGNAMKYKDFSVGLNLGYVFGKINNQQLISLEDDPAALQDDVQNNYSVRALDYNLGVLYQLVINKKALAKDKNAKIKKIMFGLRGKTATNFSTTGRYSHIGFNIPLGVVDTVSINEEIDGDGKLPATIGVGINYFIGNQFNIGFDVEYGAWTNFENSIRPTQTFNNSYRVAIGGKYRPDERGFGTFLERTSYTFGAYYQQDPRIIQTETLNNYGLNLGMSMPFYYQQNFSTLHVTFDLSQRGQGTLVEENVIQMGVGISFNDDSWFIKRKYN